MAKRKPKHFYLELYRMNYYYCIGWTQKAVENYLRTTFNYDTDLGHADGYTIRISDNRGCTILIWTKDKNDLGVLAHEATHAASFTLGRAGVKADFDNDEACAYLVGLLVDKALKN
jgi:hypothetical protein